MKQKFFYEEKSDTYKNHKYIVRLLRTGHRCGYIMLNNPFVFRKIEKFYNENFYVSGIDVHGGITFVKYNATSHYLPGQKWIGFDCCHLEDLWDLKSAKKHFDLSKEELEGMSNAGKKKLCPHAEIRSTSFVEENCKKVIESLIKMGDK